MVIVHNCMEGSIGEGSLFLFTREFCLLLELKKQESIERTSDKLLRENDIKTTRSKDIKTFCTSLVIKQVFFI